MNLLGLLLNCRFDSSRPGVRLEIPVSDKRPGGASAAGSHILSSECAEQGSSWRQDHPQETVAGANRWAGAAGV